MDIFSVLQLIGGIGLFLYGMKYLGNSLERMAGASLEKTLEKLTSNKLKGLTLGVLVTGVIQSSSATTIMLVGFVNAGIMKLLQTIPVLLGANIGTTVTGQILRLGDISSSGLVFQLLKPSSFAPLIIGIAAFMMLMSKKKKVLNIASIMMGFGILFFGMTTMEVALAPLSESQAFRDAFTTFTNPFIGVLLGILISTILQSSSAAVGILQAVSTTGNVTFAVAAPMIIGISIGKIFPIVLASIGVKKQAQQVTVSQFLISTVGGIIGMLVLYLGLKPFGVFDWDAAMSRGNIADFNTIYNILISVIFIPTCVPITKLAKKFFKAEQPSKIDEELGLLDDIFLKTPSVALEQCRKLIHSMGATAIENYGMAVEMYENYSPQKLAVMDENELFLDKSETLLSDYLVKITSHELRPAESKLATEIMHSIMDFERIGDHCIKLAEVASYNVAEKIVFSETAKKELAFINEAVSEILRLAVEAFVEDDEMKAQSVEPLEELIDNLRDTIKENHIRRLQNGNCTVQSGISLIECLTSYERISDYCSNIALHVIEKHTLTDSFDIHDYANRMHNSSMTYKNLYTQYVEKYLVPLNEMVNESTTTD